MVTFLVNEPITLTKTNNYMSATKYENPTKSQKM